MRQTRVAWLVCGSLVVCLATLITDAEACDCRRVPLKPESVLQTAEFIFAGQVASVFERTEHATTRRDGSAETTVRPLEQSATFQVLKAWRGVSTAKTTIWTDGSDCSFFFQPGDRYLIFASRRADGHPYAGLCSHTTPLEQAKPTLNMLGEPRASSIP